MIYPEPGRDLDHGQGPARRRAMRGARGVVGHAAVLGLVVGSMLSPTPAWAQGDTEPEPSATGLLAEGRALMDEGKTSEACEKFSKSHELEAQADTLVELAGCREREGRTATAWLVYGKARDALNKANRRKRGDLIAERIAAIEAVLSKLTVVVSGGRPAGFAVTLDGRDLEQPQWGTTAPIDPGAHTVRASAPGMQPWEQTVDIGRESDAQTVTIPTLEPEKTAAVPAPVAPTPVKEEQPPPAGTKSPPPPPPPATSTAADPAMQRLGLFVGSAGLLAVGVGTYFGMQAYSKWGEREDHCPDGRCSAAAAEFGDQARSAARKANIGLGLGVVGLAAGASLLVVYSGSGEPSRDKSARPATVRVEPSVGTNGGGLLLGGAW